MHLLGTQFFYSPFDRLESTNQDLRGNVRVFARIRPFLPGDGEQGNNSGNAQPFSIEGDRTVKVVDPNGSRPPRTFSFDRVFSQSDGQETVFKEVWEESVCSVLEGYNVCVFSYGQVMLS